MKRSLYFFSILLIVVFSFLYGCGDDEKGKEPDVVSEIVSELNFATGANNQTITFTTNKEWGAVVSSPQGDASWCSVSPLKGIAGTVNITVSTNENTESDDRSAIITIKTGNTIKTITIIQKARKTIAQTVHVNTPGTLSSILGDDIKNIEELTITGRIHGDDVKTIRSMFGYHNLHYLDISDAFIVAGGNYGSFYYPEVTLVNTIKQGMFNSPKLHTIYLPNTLSAIGDHAFEGCTGLTSITIPNSVISIKGSAFKGCTQLTEILVSPNNTNYSDIEGVLTSKDKKRLVAYPNGKSAQYIIPHSVTDIGENAFNDCKGLTSITIPNSVTYIRERAFSNCTSLTSIIIPNSVTFIEMYAFSGCKEVTSVTIGSGIEKIGSGSYDYYYFGSFNGCDQINEVHIKATVPPVGDGEIPYKSAVKLYVPKGSKEAYQKNQYWKGFSQYIEE